MKALHYFIYEACLEIYDKIKQIKFATPQASRFEPCITDSYKHNSLFLAYAVHISMSRVHSTSVSLWVFQVLRSHLNQKLSKCETSDCRLSRASNLSWLFTASEENSGSHVKCLSHYHEKKTSCAHLKYNLYSNTAGARSSFTNPVHFFSQPFYKKHLPY